MPSVRGCDDVYGRRFKGCLTLRHQRLNRTKNFYREDLMVNVRLLFIKFRLFYSHCDRNKNQCSKISGYNPLSRVQNETLQHHEVKLDLTRKAESAIV